MKKFLIFVCVIVLAVSALVIPACAADEPSLSHINAVKADMMEHYGLTGSYDVAVFPRYNSGGLKLFYVIYPCDYTPCISYSSYGAVGYYYNFGASAYYCCDYNDSNYIWANVSSFNSRDSGVNYYKNTTSDMVIPVYSSADILNTDGTVFFSPPTVLSVVTPQAATVITTIAGSLEFLIPWVLGLLALLIGLVLLRRVLPSFLH